MINARLATIPRNRVWNGLPMIAASASDSIRLYKPRIASL